MELDADLLILVQSNGLGNGEPDLGERLMSAFLSTLAESGRAPGRMIFLNAGIFLTTEGSAHLPVLERLVAAGTEIRSCATCLEYYGRRDAVCVGVVGNMRDTVAAVHGAKKVLTI